MRIRRYALALRVGRSGRHAGYIILGSILLHAAFIWRSTFVIDGRVTFSLFDDAMVSMRYARNLAEGHGLVWNPGDGSPVEGYTNLLWTLWMALLHLLPLDELHVGAVVTMTSSVLLISTNLLSYRLARRAGVAPNLALIAALVVTAFYGLIYWSLRGLEVALVSTLCCLSLLFLDMAREGRKSAVCGFAAVAVLLLLTRPDTPVFVAAAVAWVVATKSRFHRSLAVGTFLTLMVATAGLTAFRLSYYGDVLPNTYYLKVAGIDVVTRVWRGAYHLAISFVLSFGPGAFFVASFLVRLRSWRDYRERPSLWSAGLLASVLAAQAAYSVYVGGDAWEWMGYPNRYLSSVFPVFAVLVAVAVQGLLTEGSAERAARPSGLLAALAWLAASPLSVAASGRAAVGLAVALASYPLAHASLRTGRSISRAASGCGLTAWSSWKLSCAFAGGLVLTTSGFGWKGWIEHGGHHVREDAEMVWLGRLVKNHTDPNVTIGVVWAGTLPYFASRQAVDFLGKSDRVVARSSPAAPFWPGHNKYSFAHSVVGLAPDVVFQPIDRTRVDGLRRLNYECREVDTVLRSRVFFVKSAAARRVRFGRPCGSRFAPSSRS